MPTTTPQELAQYLLRRIPQKRVFESTICAALLTGMTVEEIREVVNEIIESLERKQVADDDNAAADHKLENVVHNWDDGALGAYDDEIRKNYSTTGTSSDSETSDSGTSDSRSVVVKNEILEDRVHVLEKNVEGAKKRKVEPEECSDPKRRATIKVEVDDD
ncbi:hypothetical protein N0V88_006240 [Collariella sp. IMI 366227]|nr:hypothetical protein N0V88_006240 [Collariella sp. IMI 366227]